MEWFGDGVGSRREEVRPHYRTCSNCLVLEDPLVACIRVQAVLAKGTQGSNERGGAIRLTSCGGRRSGRSGPKLGTNGTRARRLKRSFGVSFGRSRRKPSRRLPRTTKVSCALPRHSGRQPLRRG